MIIRGNYIYPGRTVLNPCFDAGPSSRRVRCAGRYPAGPPPFSPLDGGSRGTKINIVDDENKILDTGPTATGRGEGGVLAPACHAPLPPPPRGFDGVRHFPGRPRVVRPRIDLAACTRVGGSVSSLMAVSASFMSFRRYLHPWTRVARDALCTSPYHPQRYERALAPRSERVVDLSAIILDALDSFISREP